MPRVADLFFKAAAVFMVVGIAMGLQMSISGVHNVTGAHAHLSLLGGVSFAIFGAYFAVNAEKAEARSSQVLFWLATLSTVAMTGALYLVLLGYPALRPIIAAGSLAYFVAVVLFAWIVFARRQPVATASRDAMAR